MNIIALIGWKRSGKDTVAEYLEHKYNFYHLKFAKYIKSAADCIFPNIPLNDIELKELDLKQELDYWEIDKDTPKKEFGNRTKRDVLVDLAKYLKSTYGEDIFVKNIEREINLIYDRLPNTNIVISDLRFMVEFDWLKQLNQLDQFNVSIFDIRRSSNYYGSGEIYTDYLKIRRELDYSVNINNYIINNNTDKKELFYQIDSILKNNET